jgi:hypothetical protein
VRFNGLEEGTGNVDCLYLYEMEKIESRWRAIPEFTTCWPGNAGELIQMSSASSWGSDDPGRSFLAGLAYDERIAAIDLRWDDGEEESLEVIGETFIAVREGVRDPALVQPLDASGEKVE